MAVYPKVICAKKSTVYSGFNQAYSVLSVVSTKITKIITVHLKPVFVPKKKKI